MLPSAEAANIIIIIIYKTILFNVFDAEVYLKRYVYKITKKMKCYISVCSFLVTSNNYNKLVHFTSKMSKRLLSNKQ